MYNITRKIWRNLWTNSGKEYIVTSSALRQIKLKPIQQGKMYMIFTTFTFGMTSLYVILVKADSIHIGL